jgi:hypothetical protein
MAKRSDRAEMAFVDAKGKTSAACFANRYSPSGQAQAHFYAACGYG